MYCRYESHGTWILTSAPMSDLSLVANDFTVTTGASQGSFKLQFHDLSNQKQTLCFKKTSWYSGSVTVSILRSNNANGVNCISDIRFEKQTLSPQINRWPQQLNQFLADSSDQPGPDVFIGISQNGENYWYRLGYPKSKSSEFSTI